MSEKIPTWFFDPRVLASLFPRPQAGRTEPPPGVPADSISDPYLRAVANVYMELLNRWPTQKELDTWKTVAHNTGAHAAIAREMGVTLPKGRLLPPDAFERHVRDSVSKWAQSEVMARQAQKAEEQQKEQSIAALGDSIVGALVDLLGPPAGPKPIETLASRQLRLAEQDADLRNRMMFNQLFGAGSIYSLPPQLWMRDVEYFRQQIPQFLYQLVSLERR